MGIDSSAEYENLEFSLDEGDRLTLYTDGVPEARRSNGELYGFERLTTLFEHLPTAESSADTARSFGQDDDITVLTIQRLRLDQRIPDLSINFSPDLARA